MGEVYTSPPSPLCLIQYSQEKNECVEVFIPAPHPRVGVQPLNKPSGLSRDPCHCSKLGVPPLPRLPHRPPSMFLRVFVGQFLSSLLPRGARFVRNGFNFLAYVCLFQRSKRYKVVRHSVASVVAHLTVPLSHIAIICVWYLGHVTSTVLRCFMSCAAFKMCPFQRRYVSLTSPRKFRACQFFIDDLLSQNNAFHR